MIELSLPLWHYPHFFFSSICGAGCVPCSISIRLAKPRSVWIVVIAWGGRLEGLKAASVPGESLADNNVAQHATKSPSWVCWCVISSSLWLLYPMWWHGTHPVLHFPLHVLPPSLTCSQSNMCFFRYSISLTSMIPLCLQGKVDVAGHLEEEWANGCSH